MEDRYGKYIRLFSSLFFLVTGFIIAVIILMLLIRLFFGLLSYIPWITYIYMGFIILVPAALFIPAYVIYFRRTASHPSKFVKWLSYAVFSIAMLVWSVFLVLDIAGFFKHAYTAIGNYRSYDMIFLAANVACFFLIGVIQALTAEKETDWMERANRREEKI